MKNLQELRNQQRELITYLNKLEREKTSFIEEQESALLKPLIDEMERIKKEVKDIAGNKYNVEISSILEKRKEIERQIDQLVIEQAKSDTWWYEPGTIVYEWKIKRFNTWSFAKEASPTGKTGVVAVYDGTQELPSNRASYSMPSVGDVIVLHMLKSGKPGKKFDVISQWGKINQYQASSWLAEGETPNNNILTRQRESETQE